MRDITGAARAKAARDRLTLNCALDDATPTLGLREGRKLACTLRLDIAWLRNGLSNRKRRPLDQLAVGIGGVLRVVRDHRLGHANRAARHQGHTSSGGRKLCYSQFDRHKPFNLVFTSWFGAARPLLSPIHMMS